MGYIRQPRYTGLSSAFWLGAALNRREYRREYQQFLVRLRAARKSAGFTQEQVAQYLGVPQSFVSKCESGERRVDIVELELLATVYKKNLGYFSGKKII